MLSRNSSSGSAQGEVLPTKLHEKTPKIQQTLGLPVGSSLVGFVDRLESESESLSVAQLLRDKQRGGYN
jgi:hypothetical protein